MITFTKASKKACREAHEELESNFWGDKSNAGVNYIRGKNSHLYKKKSQEVNNG